MQPIKCPPSRSVWPKSDRKFSKNKISRQKGEKLTAIGGMEAEMMDLYQDHCEVVNKSLSGKRDVDEQTHASMAVLSDRLERVKKLGEKYARIEFSPSAKKLNHSNRIVPV